MIGDSLEYLMSSLPRLSFADSDEAQMRISSVLKKYGGIADEDYSLPDILDAEATKFLTKEKSILFKQIALSNIHEIRFQKSDSDSLSAFSAYVFELKKKLEKLRIARRNNSGKEQISIPDLPLVPGSPLDEEFQLLRFKWDTLEELSSGHYADLDSLIIYKLKLLLILKKWSFNQEKGFERFIQLSKTD